MCERCDPKPNPATELAKGFSCRPSTNGGWIIGFAQDQRSLMQEQAAFSTTQDMLAYLAANLLNRAAARN